MNKSIGKSLGFMITESFVDFFLLLAFFLMLKSFSEISNSGVETSVRNVSISQYAGHVKFVVADNKFIGLVDLEHSIQVSGIKGNTLEGVKKCIDKEIIREESEFYEIEDIPQELGVVFINNMKDQYLSIDLLRSGSLVYVGVETCCEPPIIKTESGHPIQGQLYDTELGGDNSFIPIEVRNDATNTGNSCENDFSQKRIVEEVIPLPSNVRILDKCGIALLEFK